MPAKAPSVTAARLRSLVEPKGKPGRLAECSCLSVLSDDQLLRVAQWIREGKSNEHCIRHIQDLWAKCLDVKKLSILDAVNFLRERLMSGPQPLTAAIELNFDPLAELASLISDLKMERQRINTLIQLTPADQIGITEMDNWVRRSDRLARMIKESISDYERMQRMRQEANKENLPATRHGNRPGVQIDRATFILNAVDGVEIDFLEAVASRFEKIPGARPKLAPKLETIDVSPVEQTDPDDKLN